VQQTWIDGVKRFDAADENQRGYRDGGFLLPRTMSLPAAAKLEAPLPPVKPLDFKHEQPAKPKRTVILAQRLHPGNGPMQTDRAIVVEGQRIQAILPRNQVEVQATDRVLSASDVTPGLIDSFTTAGLSGAWNIPADQDQDEPSDPNQADLRVLDGFNAQEPLLEFLRQNGIIVAHTTAGRGNILAGTSGVFRCDGRTVEDAALNKGFALLVNLGEVPKDSSKGKGPQTRMGVAGLVRKAFTDAQNDKAKPDPKAKNPKLAALLPALEGQVPVIFAAHRADDIRTALRIAEEFKLKPVIALGTEAWMLADELAKKQVPVIVHPTMQRAAGSMETVQTLLANAALLKQAGVKVLLSTAFEGYVPKNRNLRSEAAMAAANGLGHAGALQAITADAAKFLGIDKDHGSIEVGKFADVVLYDGDPFEHATHVTQTFMKGQLVYDRGEYLKLPFDRRILPIVSGGPGAGCCLGVW
jgi:imidazolonepropionase-like amidohydrolase